MAKVTNGTGRQVSASVGGKWFHVPAGESIRVDDPRVALSLGEYGLTVEKRRDVVAAQQVPTTEGETRHTAGAQHRSDDPRQNPPGTPVTVTGDTGSTTFEPGVQGVSAAEAAAGEPNELRGFEGVDELKGEALTEALKAAGLPHSTGSVEEKRDRLREHLATQDGAQRTPAEVEAHDFDELKKYAEANGIEVGDASTSEELLAVIEAAEAGDA